MMKKALLAFAIVAFVACNSEGTKTETKDTTATVAPAVDTTKKDTTVKVAPAVDTTKKADTTAKK